MRKADASPAKSPPSRKAWYKSFSRAPWHHPPPPHRHHQLHHKLHHHHHPPHPHSHPLTRPKVHIILTAELPPPHGWQLVVHLQASHGKPGCLLPQRRRLQWSRQAAAPFFASLATVAALSLDKSPASGQLFRREYQEIKETTRQA